MEAIKIMAGPADDDDDLTDLTLQRALAKVAGLVLPLSVPLCDRQDRSRDLREL